MAFAIVLLLVLAASLAFHFVSPWGATPVASNWTSMDAMLELTAIVCGIFFVAIILFMAWSMYRYRHREDRRAEYEPENHRLEWWLIVVTSVGIAALLAPGLVVYNDFVTVPDDAVEVEAVGQQWRWTFRLPGADGKLGKTGVKMVSFDNPLGLDHADPNGQDDLLVTASEIHFREGQPVKMLLRSLDVLHNFYIPEIRAKMDLVPGQVSHFWFTPTVTGRFDILCAEFCGTGHFNMRGVAIVDDAAGYDTWLASLPTFAQSRSTAVPADGGLAAQGRELATSQGCLACHSVDGSKSLGPGWLALYGTTATLVDGTEVSVDDAYLAESITNPGARVVQGYPPVMVPYQFSDGQLAALVAFIRSLAEGQQAPVAGTGDAAAIGAALFQSQGCNACHSTDGSKLLGPGWQNLWGRTEQLTDGSSVIVDAGYFRESIANPGARVVAGFPPVMMPYQLTDEELDALAAYAQSLSGG